MTFSGFVKIIWNFYERQNEPLFILPYFMNISLKIIVQINKIYLQK